MCRRFRSVATFFDDQVIAELIEWIDIKPGRVRLDQSFAQFEIENLKPQPLGATHLVRALRQARHVPWPRGFRRLAIDCLLWSVMFNCVLQ